jgi:hypothetical protein
MITNFYDCNKFKYIIYTIALLLTLLTVAYYCVGIYVLINYYDRFKIVELNCDTKIWYYVLLCLIINVDKIFYRNYYSYEENFRLHFSITTLEIIALVFGGVEIFRNDNCISTNFNDFLYTGLWRFALANFIMQMMTSLYLSVNLINYICNKKKIEVRVSNQDFEEIDTMSLPDNRSENNRYYSRGTERVYRVESNV